MASNPITGNTTSVKIFLIIFTFYIWNSKLLVYIRGMDMTSTLEITIANVSDNNKYTGAYKKIFDIIESDIQFYSPYGTEEETMEGSNFHIVISPRPEIDKIEKISQLKNVIVK